MCFYFLPLIDREENTSISYYALFTVKSQTALAAQKYLL